ncbi:Internalin-I [Cyberlindnera fabianii]|uniref:Internalin-I n=1 Tax=Cyberlindnera fabianii TaxID=36022 RepID=A0A1V2L2M3_CYBFA|nr:Internalin-I [Cyberlindnera fabianii]
MADEEQNANASGEPPAYDNPMIRKRRLRRRKGSTKWVSKYKRKRMEEVRVSKQASDDKSSESEHEAVEGTPLMNLEQFIERIPYELIILIVENLTLLDYRLYRLLRLHPKFQPVIDSRFYVMKYDKYTPKYYLAPVGSSQALFADKAEFINNAEWLIESNKVNPEQVTIYTELSDVVHTGLYYRHEYGDEFAKSLCKWAYDKGVRLSIMMPETSFTNAVKSMVKDSRRKGSVETIVRHREDEVLMLASIDKYGATTKVLSMNSVVHVRYGASYEQFEKFLSGERVYWRHTLKNMDNLVVYVEKNPPLTKILKSSGLKHLKKLDLRGEKKELSVLRLTLIDVDLPVLEQLELSGANIKTMRGNNWPRLEQLFIEDALLPLVNIYHGNFEPRKPLGLVFADNYVPSLKKLYISADQLNVFTIKGSLPRLERLRLELRQLAIYGNSIPFIETVSHCKDVSLMNRAGEMDPELLDEYIKLLRNPVGIETLSISGDNVGKTNATNMKVWLPRLQSINFPQLKTLRLYNVKVDTIEPFRTPRLETLVLMARKGQLPQVVVIREYPMISQIITHEQTDYSSYREVFTFHFDRKSDESEPRHYVPKFAPDVRVLNHTRYGNHDEGMPPGQISVRVYDGAKALKVSGMIKLAYHESWVEKKELVVDPSVIDRRGEKRIVRFGGHRGGFDRFQDNW